MLIKKSKSDNLAAIKNGVGQFRFQGHLGHEQPGFTKYMAAIGICWQHMSEF